MPLRAGGRGEKYATLIATAPSGSVYFTNSIENVPSARGTRTNARVRA
jgi:hypothetical protein